MASVMLPILLLLMVLVIKSGSVENECEELWCGSQAIRFPFQLVKGMHETCSYPRLCVHCTEHNDAMLLLPTMKLLVRDISYRSNQIALTHDPDEDCFLKKFSQINDFVQRYQFESTYYGPRNNLSFLNCSSGDMWKSCPILVSNSGSSVLYWNMDITSCTKMFDTISPLDPYSLQVNLLELRWSKPDCTKCETEGKRCRWKINATTQSDIQCFHCKSKRIHVPKSFIFSTAGWILLGLGVIIVFKIIYHFKEKEEDQVRLDKFLEDYRAEKPTRFTYADLKRITNGFKEKLGEGAHGSVFRGKLSNEILVAVKILNKTESEGNEFINEMEIMGKIHHINVVRLLGFCAEGLYHALVYHLFPNGSLQIFIFPPDDKDNFLGWEKLQCIALGIAKGIEYLHQGCNHPIIHFDINPCNVLLDCNFTPKISDFGLAKLCSKNPSLVSMTTARGTLGYIAPEVFSRNFGNVSYKSDIYSYGMLLLEMVGGRKNVDLSSAQNFNVLYPDWIHNLVDGDVHIHVEDAGDVKIAKRLAIVGLWCIQWHPVNRPCIKSVIQMLETREENQLNMPPNPFHSVTSVTTRGLTLARRQTMELEVIEE